MFNCRKLTKCEIKNVLTNSQICKVITGNNCCLNFVPTEYDVDFTACDNVNIVLKNFNPCQMNRCRNQCFTLEFTDQGACNTVQTVFANCYLICVKGNCSCGNMKYILRATFLTGKKYTLNNPPYCNCYSDKKEQSNKDSYQNNNQCYNL